MIMLRDCFICLSPIFQDNILFRASVGDAII
jgi:hypothetical protein